MRNLDYLIREKLIREKLRLSHRRALDKTVAPASPILKYPNVSWGHTGIKDLLFTYLCHECVVNVGLVKVELLQLQRDSQNTR